jgi:hypothetical protein
MLASRDLRTTDRGSTDRRSIGRADDVVALVRRRPRLLGSLIECLWSDDPVLVARSANAAEKLSREMAARFQPWKDALLDLLATAQQSELRWQLALIVPRMNLTVHECRRAAAILESRLEDRTSLVKTFAMQGLADLLRQDPSPRAAVLDLLRIHTRSGTPAMRARGRILLKQLEDANIRTDPAHPAKTGG